MTNAQVENVYVESLIQGQPNDRVENLYVETLFSSTPRAQLDNILVESLLPVPATPSVPTFPASRSGTAFWLRAKDIVAPGATAVGWLDRSPLGLRTTVLTGSHPTLVVGATPSGGQAVNFAGSQSVNLANTALRVPFPTASVSSTLSASYPASLLTNGMNVVTGGAPGWASSAAPSVGTPQWAQFDYPAAFVATKITIKIANEASRGPRDFTVQGWNGSTWDILHTVTGETGWSSSTPKSFTFSNTTSYSRYRLHVTAVQAGGDIVYLDEIVYNDLPNTQSADIWIVLKANAGAGGTPVGMTGFDARYPGVAGGTGSVIGDFGDTSSAVASFTPTVSTTAWRIYRIVVDRTLGTAKYYLDGALQHTDTITAYGWGLNPFYIGQGGGAYFNGQIAEIYATTNLMSTDEAANMTAYLNTEHGLTVAVDFFRTVPDTAVGSDIVDSDMGAGGVDRTANIDDIAIGIDSGVGSIAAGEYINDHAVALDSLTTVGNIIVDTAAATDAVTKVGDKRVTLADPAVATDSVQVDEKRVFIADNATATDQVRSPEVLIADTAVATDSLVTRSGVNNLADTATATDVITVEQTGRLNDFATATDQVIVDFRPGCRISLEKSRHLVPWHSTAETIDLPFGEAQGIPLVDGTYVATVNMEPDTALNWYLRVYKLDASLAITGYVDVPTSMDSFAATSVLIEDYKIRVLCSRMSAITSRTHEVVDLDVSGSVPAVLAHSTNSPGGVGSASYSAGISANYIPGDDLTCYGYYQFGVLKGNVWMGESGPYPPASYYTIWGYDPTPANPRRFPYVAHKGDTPGDPTKMDIEVGETSVTPAGIVSHTLLFSATVPQTNSDAYWIRPLRLNGDRLTVFERVLGVGGGDEVGWQVAVYNLTAGTREAVLGLVLEDATHPQYLAMNPSVHFDGLGNFMCFADMGPDWGTSADWGAGTLHPGFERQVVYYSAGGQHLSKVKVPRPTTDGHGEMDSLSSRSTSGWFNPTTGAWAMASTMTDLYEASGNYYATDFWAGFLYCGGGGGLGGGTGGGGTGGSGTAPPNLSDPATATDSMGAVWHYPRTQVPVVPTVVKAGVGTLGCGVNTAAVYDRGGVNRLFVIDQLTSIEYSRVRDDMSDALLHIPTSAECCRELSLIEPVRHELVIFRDNIRVWEGPITRLGFSNDDIELAAKDVLFWAYRTIMRAGYSNAHPNTGYGTDRVGLIMRSEMVRKEQQVPPINVLPYLQIHTTEDTARTARSTLPYQKTVFEEMDDMAAKAGLDFTAVGRAIHVQDTEYVLGETTLATEADFLGGVIVSMYGMDLATYSAVTDGQGNFGDARADTSYYGEVEMLETAYDEDPTDNTDPEAPVISIAELTSQAQRNQSGRYPVPVEVRVPDNSQINPNSQVFTFDMLVPGVKVPLLALSGCKRLRQDQKIDSVTVRQDENGEVVTMTLIPFPKSQVTNVPTSVDPLAPQPLRFNPTEAID